MRTPKADSYAEGVELASPEYPGFSGVLWDWHWYHSSTLKGLHFAPHPRRAGVPIPVANLPAHRFLNQSDARFCTTKRFANECTFTSRGSVTNRIALR